MVFLCFNVNANEIVQNLYFLIRIIGIESDSTFISVLLGAMAVLLPWKKAVCKTLNIIRNNSYFDSIKL